MAAIFKTLFTKLCPLPGGFNFEPETLPMLPCAVLRNLLILKLVKKRLNFKSTSRLSPFVKPSQ